MDAVWVYVIVIGVVAGAHLGLFLVLRRLMREDRRRRVQGPRPPQA